MRKLMVVIAVVVMVLLGCVTTPTEPAKFTATVDDSYKDGAVVVVGLGLEVERSWGRTEFRGVTIGIKNLTKLPVIVVWDQSSINYGGTSHAVFLDGQKYIDAGRGVPNQVIAAGMYVTHAVFPADNVFYISSQYGGWNLKPILAEEVSVLLSVKVGGEDRFYTVTFVVESFGG